LLVTALHVVAEAKSVAVLLPGGTPQTADVIAVDVPDDLAILRIPQSSLPALPLGEVSTLRVGQDVITVGYPIATLLSPSAVTVTRGIVSAIRPPFIQVDAAMNPGNSGGPVLDSRGNVIGVADRKVVMTAVEGLNFAISVDAVRQLLLVAIDQTKDHLPLPLPLMTTIKIELAYGSGGIGDERHTELAVSCISPPPRAESLTGVQGKLQAPTESWASPISMSVVTWLSFDGGGDLGSQDTFGYMSHNASVTTPIDTHGTNASLPNSICLNYAAVRTEFDFFARTFKVIYLLSFKVWSPSVVP
jgi:hypothetical protein